MEDRRQLSAEQESEAGPFFDPFSAQPPEPEVVTEDLQSIIPQGGDVPQEPDAEYHPSPDGVADGVPQGLSAPDYSEPQHRIQLSDQLHVDIPDEILSDAQAHLWKNGFPGMNQTDTIAALLRSGVITQGVPIEGGNAFYREHGIIPNAQAADALRGYFQDVRPESSLPGAPVGVPLSQPEGPARSDTQDLMTLRDQHDISLDSIPNPDDLMQALGQTNKNPPDPISEAISEAISEDDAIPVQRSGPRSVEKPAAPGVAGSQPTGSANSATAGRGGFALPGLPDFGLRSFIASRAEHSRSRQAADLENTRLDLAMEAAQDALKGVDPYLPSSGIPEDDRAVVYAERLKNDPEAHAAHYKVIGRFKRLQDTVEQWTDAAKDNPVLQKEADKKLKAVSDLMKSGEAIPDATFKENLEKITKAISEMFSRIFQKLGFGKSAEAGVS